MSSPIDLHAEEKILLKLRKHWIVLVRDVGATALLGILPFFLFGGVGLAVPSPVNLTGLLPFGALIAAVWLLAVWMTLAILWTNWYLDLWIVTNQRIISVDQISLFNRKITTLELDNIVEITVHTQNILESLLHFGKIEIETAGPENDVQMEGIPHPERIRTLLLEQANLFRQHEDDELARQQLLRTVSHEVKNYLAKDAAALAEIAEGSFDRHPGMLKSVAAQALSETRRGVKTVMSMLDAPDGTLMQLEAIPFDLQPAIRALAREYEVAANKKGLSFSVSADASCPIIGDEEKLTRLVFKNLLDNALKYTPGGAVALALEKNGTVARVSVADTGVGLSEEDAARLFTPGGRGEESRDLNPESTGYGLAIAKMLVEAHGGTIRAESAGKGAGSTFIVELPIAG